MPKALIRPRLFIWSHLKQLALKKRAHAAGGNKQARQNVFMQALYQSLRVITVRVTELVYDHPIITVSRASNTGRIHRSHEWIGIRCPWLAASDRRRNRVQDPHNLK